MASVKPILTGPLTELEIARFIKRGVLPATVRP